MTGEPYAHYFEVVEAQVVGGAEGGADLLLMLHAPDRPPQLFFTMFYQRDMLFAMCGG